MTASANLYANAFKSAFGGKINWTSDTIKLGLLTAAYTANLGTDTNWGDINANEVSGTGYTAGGATLGSCTLVTTAANSWGLTAATSHAYIVGDVVKPSGGNGFLYRCVVAGTSGGSAPSWPTIAGETVTDGGVTWVCFGESITVLSSAAGSWSGVTLAAAAEYGAVYDAQSGSSATDPLVVLNVFSPTLNPTAGAITVTPDSVYGWGYLAPA